MKQLSTIIALLLFLSLPARGQEILDHYVQIAIAQNLNIAQKQALELKQDYALQHAARI